MVSTARRFLILSVLLAALAVSGPARSARQSSSNADPLTVHEWGTFTSIADHSGQAIRWYPSSGPGEIPDFVEHLYAANFKVGLSGTVRMETPVIYFYTSHETEVSVHVSFPQGLITEWYPHASHVGPNPKVAVRAAALFNHPADGIIRWDSVAVEPSSPPNFPRDKSDSHYYAARETSAAPVLIKTGKGIQQEKFLFYRGVATFPIPVAVRETADNRVLVKNLGLDEVPSVILFERRGDKIGYRLGGSLQSEVQLDPPELNSDIESLSNDLEQALIAQGLYADEARAMVATWQHSWFEEGSRLLYIVPRNFVDSVLPLSIKPSPAQTVRVFVGRIELVTPATERAVETALAAHDIRAIMKYGRFLEPILDRLRAENPAHAQELNNELAATYSVPITPPTTR